MRLPELVQSYVEYCRYIKGAEKSGTLDLSKISWVYPTTFVPLAGYIEKNENRIAVIPPEKTEVKRYLDVLKGIHPNMKKGKSCVPIIQLKTKKDDVDELLKGFEENEHYCGGKNCFNYLVNELIANIYEHSKFTNAYVAAQRYDSKKFTEICFYDNGITIPGSYENKGMRFKDSEAIIQALNGLSSKDEQDRGHGLSSSTNIILKEFGGDIFIVSRKSGVFLSKNLTMGYNLEGINVIQGTMLGIRIPLTTKAVDIYGYV